MKSLAEQTNTIERVFLVGTQLKQRGALLHSFWLMMLIRKLKLIG